jgi:drug/metabolite transporter (DMT)-like permease
VSEATVSDSTSTRGRLILAFALVYVVWGSTYLAIRFAIETAPPFLMASARFLVAGLILYGFARWRGAARPSLAEWRATAIIGAALFLFGNGGVVWAEQFVPSGLAALLVATVPLWMVLFEWLLPGGKRPAPMVWLGVAVGLGGVGLLAKPGAAAAGSEHYLTGVAALMVASIVWSLGSLYAKRATLPSSMPLTIGMQMLAGGFWLGLLSLTLGEPARFDPAAISAKSFWAVAYLVVFGALIGFSAYQYVLHHTTPARAATYAYVNPVVAMLLGWAFAGEAITPRTVAAAAIVLAGVAIIVLAKTGKASGARGAETTVPGRDSDVEPMRRVGGSR